MSPEPSPRLFAARDQLAAAIDHYTDGYITSVSDGQDVEGYNYVTLHAGNREDGAEIELDIYEAFWGDLVPDWSQENPWTRFKRASKLIWYWSFGGVVKSAWRKEMPTRTVWAMLLAAACLLLWYLVTAKVLVTAINGTDSGVPQAILDLLPAAAPANPVVVVEGETPSAPPETPFFEGVANTINSVFQAITQALISTFIAIVNWVNALPLVLFFVGLIGLSRLESISNVASFTRAYLRDDPMGEDAIGLRAKSRYRVLDVLDHIHSKTAKPQEGEPATGTPLYTDVHVVAHSLGGAIAVDALAEYGQHLSKTVLHTWGGAFGVLVQQEPLVEMEIGKLHNSKTRLLNWIDVVIRKDIFASDRKTPYVYENGVRSETKKYAALFPPTLNPPMPMRYLFGYTELHSAYYRSEDAMLMLVKPVEDLPPLVVPTLPKGSLTND